MHMLNYLADCAGLIVSCARRAMPDLPGKLIDIITLPPADPAHPLAGERAPVIQVSDGGIKVWLLPLEDCETWAVSRFQYMHHSNESYYLPAIELWALYQFFSDTNTSARNSPQIL